MTLYEEIKQAIIDMEDEKTPELVQKALDGGESAMKIIQEGLIPGIEVVGEKFKTFEFFLPEVIMAAKAFKNAFIVLEPILADSGYEPKGRVLIGSVEGDNHDIGKNIVLALLQGNGYEVHDAGVNVSPVQFVELVKEKNPNVVGMSSLLTTTMANMKNTVTALEEAGLRDSLKIIIGGAPASSDYAQKIGADGYGEDATDAIALVNGLLGK